MKNKMNAIALLSATTVTCTAFVTSASADVSAFYDWSNLGTDPAYSAVANGSGEYSRNLNQGSFEAVLWEGRTALQINEDPVSGTPQIYIGLVENVLDGDVISASGFGWGLGDSAGSEYSKVRLWGYYVGEDGDYSASGAGRTSTADYSSSDTEWTEVNAEWTFDSSRGVGFMIEARIYSYSSTETPSTWLTDLSVNVTGDNAQITLPVPAPGVLALLGMGGLVTRRRRA